MHLEGRVSLRNSRPFSLAKYRVYLLKISRVSSAKGRTITEIAPLQQYHLCFLKKNLRLASCFCKISSTVH